MRGLFNWTYTDVVAVLLANGFTEETSHISSGTSHHYFVDSSKEHMVVVQLHAGKSIRPKTLENIINTSGLPKRYWREASKLGKKTLKKNPYKAKSVQ